MEEASEKQVLFSIVTVTLNNLSGLQKTQKSIEKQNLKGFEWVVIDGGSNDGTKAFLETLNGQWISEPDTGLYDAMNKGLERCNGEYVLFLNAGDVLANCDTLETLQTATRQCPDFIYGDSWEGNSYKPARKPDITKGMFTHHQAMLFRRAAISNLRYDTTYKIAADYDFLARFLTGDKKIAYCPKPICIFEQGGLSQTHAKLGRHEQFKIRKKLKLAGPFRNTMITFTQAALWQFRNFAPALYWHLKSSGNTARANRQNNTRQTRPANPA